LALGINTLKVADFGFHCQGFEGDDDINFQSIFDAVVTASKYIKSFRFSLDFSEGSIPVSVTRQIFSHLVLSTSSGLLKIDIQHELDFNILTTVVSEDIHWDSTARGQLRCFKFQDGGPEFWETQSTLSESGSGYRILLERHPFLYQLGCRTSPDRQFGISLFDEDILPKVSDGLWPIVLNNALSSQKKTAEEYSAATSFVFQTIQNLIMEGIFMTSYHSQRPTKVVMMGGMKKKDLPTSSLEEGSGRLALSKIKLLGVTFRSEEESGRLVVSKIKADGLCSKSGLSVGDEVIAINDVSCDGMVATEAASLFKAGTESVKLLVCHETSKVVTPGGPAEASEEKEIKPSSAEAMIPDVVGVTAVSAGSPRPGCVGVTVVKATQATPIGISFADPTVENDDGGLLMISKITAGGLLSSSPLQPGFVVRSINDVSTVNSSRQDAAKLIKSLSGPVCIVAQDTSGDDSYAVGMVVKPTPDTPLGVRFLLEEGSGRLTLSNIKPDGLCSKSGLAVGDEVIAINDVSCEGMTATKAASLVKAGTEGVKILVRQQTSGTIVAAAALSEEEIVVPGEPEEETVIGTLATIAGESEEIEKEIMDNDVAEIEVIPGDFRQRNCYHSQRPTKVVMMGGMKKKDLPTSSLSQWHTRTARSLTKT